MWFGMEYLATMLAKVSSGTLSLIKHSIHIFIVLTFYISCQSQFATVEDCQDKACVFTITVFCISYR